jgi:C1A family cysteine protease
MKTKFLSLILAVLMIALCIPTFHSKAAVANAATLPAAVDLRTTKHLPPIGNQGAVGCCASMAITYMQFTNAYSRYIHSTNPNSSFNPSSGQNQYLFSPRFTYNLAGAGTAWVYEVLKDHGTVLQTQSNFQYDSYGGAMDNTMASDWATIDGYWQSAQNFKIKNYDQVWIGNDPYKFKMTTSDAGLALIERIKTSLHEGNVVVTGGYPARWQYATISGRGTYGKSGERAICYSKGTDAGGHQVSIVGYDDNITCTVNGVTLKGAFLVANSWGTGWENDGYTWMMYDALNEQSAYSALNFSGRTWTMDQMCFLDWKTDLNVNNPGYVAAVKITAKNRDALTVKVTATGLDGSYLEYIPYMFDMEFARPYTDVNFYGRTTSESGVLAFGYEELLKMIPQGKTVNDYRLGLVVSTDSGYTATVNWVKLFDPTGTLIYENATSSPISSGGSVRKELGKVKILTVNAPEGVSVSTVSGTTHTNSSGSYQFKINIPEGYSAKSLHVTAGGTALYPVNGVYTVDYSADTSVQITGVVPSAKNINMGHYCFEYWGGDNACVYIVSISKSDVSKATYDSSALASGNYRYTFRITVNGVTYELVPSSFYEFEYSTLYRLPIANCGWIPAKGSYDLKIELCYDKVPVYVDSSVVAKCEMDVYSTNGMKSHTHSYTGNSFAVTHGTCSHSGEGFRYCGTAGCCAMIPITTDQIADAHLFDGEATLIKNATSDSQGIKKIPCAHCGTTTDIFFTPGPCDADGNDDIDISDVTLMLQYLAGTKGEQDVACDVDINGDGYSNISDITRLLYVLSKS